jgi:hypothetical protein
MPTIRHVLALLLVSALALLAGCAWMPTAAANSCEVATVPAGAVFGLRQGMDVATYPAATPTTGTGCQRVWYGQRSHPDSMQVLATYYYSGGHVDRLIGRVPGGAEYECHYRGGDLDTARSRNAAQCPKATEARPFP